MKNTIHLQSYGRAEAKPAIDFTVGEKMLWNFGERSTIVAIVKETEKYITFQFENTDRRLAKHRLVAIG
jgi:hypothetical protein